MPRGYACDGTVHDPLAHAAGVLLDDANIESMAADLRLAAQKLRAVSPELAERLDAWADTVQGGEDDGFDAAFLEELADGGTP